MAAFWPIGTAQIICSCSWENAIIPGAFKNNEQWFMQILEGQTECIMGNWKIENGGNVVRVLAHFFFTAAHFHLALVAASISYFLTAATK